VLDSVLSEALQLHSLLLVLDGPRFRDDARVRHRVFEVEPVYTQSLERLELHEREVGRIGPVEVEWLAQADLSVGTSELFLDAE